VTFPRIASDLHFADGLIAQSMGQQSWTRNRAWVTKFREYISRSCPGLVEHSGISRAVASDQIALAFLACVAREDPRAKTRVDSAKRAVNFVRSLAGVRPLETSTSIRLLARSVRTAIAHTVRQSPALPAIFVRTIALTWGSSNLWWKVQVALMILMGVVTVARGAEMVAWRRDGIAWVRPDGTQFPLNQFSPALTFGSNPRELLRRIRGFLLLFPSRKNKQSTPSWIPSISAPTILLLSRHLQWLDAVRPSHGEGACLFPARVCTRNGGQREYLPNLCPDSAMSVNVLRTLLRQALVECCGLTDVQAKEFGTHCIRVGAIEILRQRGVPADLRQQLGGWMSAASALGYLQLPVNAQFNLLRTIFQ